MKKGKRLRGEDILGKRIASVYEKKLEKTGRFQNRLTFVRLSNAATFCLDELRFPQKGAPLKVWSCDPDKPFTEVLSIKKEPRLDSPIKAIVFCEHFDIDTAILLENEFILTIGVGEFDMGYSFYKLPKEYSNNIPLKIAR